MTDAVAILSVLSAAALAWAAVELALRRRALPGPAPFLLGGTLLLALAVAGTNVAQWLAGVAQADVVENFLWPLVPTFALFLFIAGLEARDRRRIESAMDRLVALHRLGVEMAGRRDREALLKEIVKAAAAMCDAQVCFLFLHDAERDRLRLRAAHGMPMEEVEDITLRAGEGVTGTALADNATQAVTSVAEATKPALRDRARQYGLEAAAATPLRAGRQARGILFVARREARAFDTDAIRTLETLAGHAAAVLDAARLVEELAAGEARLRALVETPRIAVVAGDAALKIGLWNRAAETLFGIPADRALGRTVEAVCPEGRGTKVRGLIQSALGGETTVSEEVPLVLEGGRRLVVRFHCARIGRPAAVDLAWLCFAEDATQEVGIREHLTRMQKAQTLGRLAAGVVHDFNNLLTGIRGFANLARQDADPDSEVAQSLMHIDEGARRGIKLVDRLRMLAPNGGREVRPVCLNAIVEEVLMLCGRSFLQNIRTSTVAAPDLDVVQADPAEVQHLLMNLVVNARDAMREGGTLTLATENATFDAQGADAWGLPAGRYVRLTVADTGPGIRDEVRARIFDPFFTTKDDPAAMGLGLPTVQAIAARLGGTVACESVPGAGAAFIVLLPVAPEPHDPTEAAAPPPAKRGRTPEPP